jgi:hypothetical protein
MMRRLAPFALAAISLSATGCTTSAPHGSPKIETTKEAERDSLEGVAESPLRDANILRTKIPPVLLEAVADPYELPDLPKKASRLEVCRLLDALVTPLDEALGPDLDVPVEKQGLAHRGRDTAMGWMATAASDVVPFHSWIRKLSGAERHDQLVQNAITAGAVRRAYLKGLGEAHGCDPPATPSHVKAGTPPPTQALKWRPLYPIR